MLLFLVWYISLLRYILFHFSSIVTFKSIATKESANQCNLSGKPFWMLTDQAPDPRDIYWSNVGVDYKVMENRRIIVEALLCLGVLCWGVVVTAIQALTKQVLISFENLAPVTIGLVEGKLMYDNTLCCAIWDMIDYRPMAKLYVCSHFLAIFPSPRLHSRICGFISTDMDTISVFCISSACHPLQVSLSM